MSDVPRSDEQLRFERLQRLLLDSHDVDRFLVELARVAATVVQAPVAVGITVRYEHGLLTVGSSDPRAEVLDETQYRDGDGPCLQALQTGQVVEVADTLLDHRWPVYASKALESGLRCSVSLPLSVNGDTFGALNVYGFDSPQLFGPPAVRELELFAAQAAGTLRVAIRQVKDSTLLSQMEQSLRSRTVIDQALGIIMRDQRCTASTAFELLRRESQNNHRRLQEVAADLITTITGHPPEEGRAFDAS